MRTAAVVVALGIAGAGASAALAQRGDRLGGPKSGLTPAQIEAHNTSPVGKATRDPERDGPGPGHKHGDPVCVETYGQGGAVRDKAGHVRQVLPATTPEGLPIVGVCLVE